MQHDGLVEKQAHALHKSLYRLPHESNTVLLSPVRYYDILQMSRR